MALCARCNKKLGLRRFEPEPDWQIDGKICTNCNKHISENTSYYEAEYKEDELDFPKEKGTLAIQNFDDKRRVLFIVNDNIEFEIPLQSIQKCENVDFTEKSMKKKVATLGINDKSTSKHLQITFVGDHGVYSPLFHVKDLEEVSNSLNGYMQKYREEAEKIKPEQGMIDAIKNARGIQFEDSGISGKSDYRDGEIKKIKKYLTQHEKILYVTRQERERHAHAKTSPNMIFATDKRIIIESMESFGRRNHVKDMPYDSIRTLKLQEGPLSSDVVFNGAGFVEINTITQASLQRAWGFEEETTLDSIPKADALRFTDVIREQIEKSGVKNLEFTHTNQDSLGRTITRTK